MDDVLAGASCGVRVLRSKLWLLSGSRAARWIVRQLVVVIFEGRGKIRD